MSNTPEKATQPTQTPQIGARKIYIFDRTRGIGVAVFILQMILLAIMVFAGLAVDTALSADVIKWFFMGYGIFCIASQIAVQIPALIAVSGNAAEHLAKGLGGFLGKVPPDGK